MPLSPSLYPDATAAGGAKPSTVLTQEQIQSFIDVGYCVLRDAFSARQAAAACRCVWRRMEQKAGIRENDPASWPEAYDIEEHLDDPEVLDCFTDRLAVAVNQLLGPGRWSGFRKWGLWPVNFYFGSDQPYDYPTTSWHVDGNWFTHSIDCPLQGLLLIGLFTDIRPQYGGTILAGESHKATARVLARHPEGISHFNLFSEVLAEPIGNFVESTGKAGDVVLAHPFLFHTRGMKHRGPPRIISNTEASLKQPLVLQRQNPEDYSVLELSIIQALREAPAAPKGARLCRF
jgi:hypothetical protein